MDRSFDLCRTSNFAHIVGWEGSHPPTRPMKFVLGVESDEWKIAYDGVKVLHIHMEYDGIGLS